MCMLVVLWRMTPDAPLIVAANREESFSRPGSVPTRVVDGPVEFVAGLDERAGGTWLGLNRQGVLVAVTNADKRNVPSHPRSRGLLARDLLGFSSAREAQEHAAAEFMAGRYDGCRLLVADRESLAVVQGTELVQVFPLPAGPHVLVNRAGVNQLTEPRTALAHAWLEQQPCTRAAEWEARLPELLGWTGDGVLPPICLRGEGRGTVSSSILLLGEKGERNRYLHAQGPPDQTAYEDFSHLIADW